MTGPSTHSSAPPQKTRSVTELLAIYAATSAALALLKAIQAFENAGFNPRVTLPLREALSAIEAAIREVHP